MDNKEKIRLAINQISINNCDGSANEDAIKAVRYLQEVSEAFSLQGVILPDVSQRSELYFAFMEEYNALMGKSEHQILKEEVIVLLAKYSG
jgi:hypothetical protein